ncbi:MAG: hypothetical protein DMF98_21340 [Acidobacteria bacterium]|nr:MAG: hypothetical protein DMF98_21340 [Acidobacteriota bacterium]
MRGDIDATELDRALRRSRCSGAARLKRVNAKAAKAAKKSWFYLRPLRPLRSIVTFRSRGFTFLT